MAERPAGKSTAARIALAWLIVVVPTAWGLTHTVENALKIFSTNAPPSAPAAPPTR